MVLNWKDKYRNKHILRFQAACLRKAEPHMQTVAMAGSPTDGRHL